MENIFGGKKLISSRGTNSISSILTVYANKILLLQNLPLPPLAIKLLPLANSSILELIIWLKKYNSDVISTLI